MSLDAGQRLKYACREFIKGQGDDEERLMRRIMIARRNNIRDHETLKKARNLKRPGGGGNGGSSGESEKRRKFCISEHLVEREMDVAAVEATRSYKKWMELPDGAEFSYNQCYTKGKEGHDWLLKKNIWRRMRYRRENKAMVDQIKTEDPRAMEPDPHPQHHHVLGIGDPRFHHHHQEQRDGLTNHHAHSIHPLHHAAAAAAAAVDHFADQVAIAAAVAAAESFGKSSGATSHHQHGHHFQRVGDDHHAAQAMELARHLNPHHRHVNHHGTADGSPSLMVHDPLQAAAAQAALDAAAKLAAVTHPGNLHDDHHRNEDDVTERLLMGDPDDHVVDV